MRMRTVSTLLVATALLAEVCAKISGDCAERRCFIFSEQPSDFFSAQRACQERDGHLLTVRSTAVHKLISNLLTAVSGRFWIGLRSAMKQCAQPPSDLQEFVWVTGDNQTNFVNWRTLDPRCAQTCVSVSSSEDLKWTQHPCAGNLEGYLCEYSIPWTCAPLQSASPVLYDTPYAFSRADLKEVPHGSNATKSDLGTKHICYEGSWINAPWTCEVYNGGCSHSCTTENDRPVCTCPPGYTLQSNGVTCCHAGLGPCEQAISAQNAAELCPDGHELAEDGQTCRDVDECQQGQQCPANSLCFNTVGSFRCQCEPGFFWVGDRCEDENECESGPCEHNCNNTMGSYHCHCFEGFSVSLTDRHKCIVHCADMECPAVSCDFNNPNQCDCPPGFIFEEREPVHYCLDIDECVLSFECEQICTNTPGSYTCSCHEGFQSNGSRCNAVGMTTPRTERYPGKTASTISDGGLLAIIVSCVLIILLLVCAAHHCVKRFGKMTSFTLNKDCPEDLYALQLVTSEKYTQRLPISNVNFR